MQDREREFAQACLELYEAERKHTGNLGCVLSLVIGFAGGIAADYRLFLAKPKNRVDTMIEEHLRRHLSRRDSPEIARLTTAGLPHGSRCE